MGDASDRAEIFFSNAPRFRPVRRRHFFSGSTHGSARPMQALTTNEDSMAFTMTPLLIYSDAVPAQARDVLRAAWLGPLEQRDAALEAAARVLYRETDLDCNDTRELIGLPVNGCCG
jgi:hypothetical protein